MGFLAYEGTERASPASLECGVPGVRAWGAYPGFQGPKSPASRMEFPPAYPTVTVGCYGHHCPDFGRVDGIVLSLLVILAHTINGMFCPEQFGLVGKGDIYSWERF